ncbi:MAG: hypothetical protein HYT40_00010 [Candidatus Sungbacteria bacterium]|uniref:Uncharacterized protein n=1 Tax=Candidatus Sungiibacteriota bacterium TaxID=2750080 RepID=A0A931WP90_9BACT|nr:hypothetical protein [Candidatus Sungbacteria bacterium]
MKHRSLAGLFFMAAIVSLFLMPVLSGRNTAMAVSSPFIPFGGRILTSTYCIEGQWITVGPPWPGSFVFTAGSILYAWYQIFRPGPWALGIALPISITCSVPCPAGFCPIGAGLKIDKVGTSLK